MVPGFYFPPGSSPCCFLIKFWWVAVPFTGQPMPERESREIVVTTLARTGMPLILYRSGDVSRFIPGKYPCGSVLKRLGRVSHSLDRIVPLGLGNFLTMSQLDEALFFSPRGIRFSG